MKHKYESPCGNLIITHDKNTVLKAAFDEGKDVPLFETNHPICVDLNNYFLLGLPLRSPIVLPDAPAFTKSIWLELLKIPYGSYTTYKDLALRVNNEKAVRAVGQACKKNPIGVFVPCHRVLSVTGALTGYSGKEYVHLKEALLKHERSL